MRKKLNNKNRKEDILNLRSEGKSYREIKKELGCSSSIISYHCGSGTEKQRCAGRNKKRTILERKISSFKCKLPRKILTTKLSGFKCKSAKGRYRKSNGKVNNIIKNYSSQDVINKIGETPCCYLTGEKIDLNDGESYHLDHIIPTAKGGTNDLDNLGICIADANLAKGSLSVKGLYKLCKDILDWRDREK